MEEPVNRRNIPDLVWDKLLAFEQAAEDLTQRLANTRDGIANARTRLTGGFQKDANIGTRVPRWTRW
jgi:hypothetical protein